MKLKLAEIKLTFATLLVESEPIWINLEHMVRNLVKKYNKIII